MVKKIVVSAMLALLLTGCGSPEEKSEKLYNESVVSFDAGEVDQARIEAQNAIKLNPKSAKAYLMLARCAVKKQNWRGAFGAFSQSVELDPELIEAQLGLGRIYLLAQQFDEAEKVVTTILEKSPNNKDAHLLRAGILLQTKSYSGAEAILRTVLRDDSQNIDAKMGLITIYERTGKIETALATIDKALMEHPDNAMLYYKAASIAMAMKLYDEAEKYYLQLADVVPDKNAVQPMLAQLYDASGNKEKSLAIVAGLVRDNPENVEYRISLAALYVREKEYAKALSLLDAAEVKGGDIRLDLGKVDIFSAQDQVQEVESTLIMIVETYPENPLVKKAVLKLALLYFQQEKYIEAIATLEESGTLTPDMHFVRAQARFATEDLEGAIADLRIVRKELPENLKAREQLAKAYLAQDKGLLAVEELHDILNSNDDYSSSRDILVSYYARYGQWDFAQEELQKLIDQHPEDPKYLIALGDIYRIQKDMDSARKTYQAILDLPKGQGPAYLRLGLLAEQDGDVVAALGFYDKALEIHPKSAVGIERKLLALSNLGDQKAFVVYKDELLDSNDESPVLYDILGRIAAKNGDNILAEKEFRKSSELAPEWAVPYQRLIQIYLADNNVEKAIVQCKEVLAKNPDAVVEAFLLGQIYQVKGELELAEKYYESLLAQKPDFLPAANNLAYLYTEGAKSEADLTKALELAKRAAKGKNPESLDTLGWVYHLLGNREQSMQALNEAYKANPENKTIAFHLATVLVKWSYNFEAKEIIEAALADGQDFPEKKAVEEMLARL